VVAQPDERRANKTDYVLESGMTDTERSTISSLNEEEPNTLYDLLQGII